ASFFVRSSPSLARETLLHSPFLSSTSFPLHVCLYDSCTNRTTYQQRHLQHIRRRGTNIQTRRNDFVGFKLYTTRSTPNTSNTTCHLHKITSKDGSQKLYLLITRQQPLITITENRQLRSNI